jgi:hypothetical protein
MHSERDVLVKKVFPLLREKLIPYRIKLIDIDLRWGITEDQSENDETIDFCLHSIEGCRPFFLGMMGERYGWIPGTEMGNTVAKFPDRISITAMEIIHGVLSDEINNEESIQKNTALNRLVSTFVNDKTFKSNALFFFRNPEFEKTMP